MTAAGVRARQMAVLATVAGIVLTLGWAPGAADADEPGYTATIRRDSFGVPHILADDYASLGFGGGYAFAQDNICTLMDFTVTIRGERSRFFGPDGSWQFRGNGSVNNNLNSDFFYTSIIEAGVVEELIAQEPPHGPLPGVREAVRGYVAGVNQYLDDIGGADGVTDPRCVGAEWVRPMEEIDAYRRYFQLSSLASTGVAIDGIGGAQPPTGGVIPDAGLFTLSLPSGTTASVDPDVFAGQMEALQQFPDRFHEAIGIGSNAYAFGADATDNGMGMVLGNPHFPWHGGERLYQIHLTIPGAVNAVGAGLYGVPLVLIGHTEGVAWSHTVSTAFRFTPFELQLVPGSPTTYLVDGTPEEMTSQELTVEVQQEDGSIGTATRTLYTTRYGPVLTSILGLPLFPWTSATAYALGDANHHMRYVNQFFQWNHAQSVEELFDIQKEYLSVPWVNTIAADREGNALYSDVSVVPNVPDDKATMCSGALGLVTFAALGLPTLDGSRTECDWDTDDDAVVPGIFGPSNLPHLLRRDWVANSNDSYWLSHPDEPLTGFASIVGDEETARTLRTRLGIVMAQERLSGQDSYGDRTPGDVMTQDVLQDVVFNNRQHAAELVRDDLVDLCQSLPGGQTFRSTGEPVEVGDACQILADWDMRDDLDSPGAILFRRFWSNLVASPVPIDLTDVVTSELPNELVDLLPVSLVTPAGAPWSTPFDVDDPVNTPRDLDTDNPRVQEALGDAIANLDGAGIPLDGTLRDWQYVTRLGERIPIHGGPGALGVFNALNSVWRGNPDAGPVGYPEVQHGSSFVMAAHFVDPALNDGCPVDADAIVTYSQSEDETRPFFADQTRMYAEKEWNPMYFCESDLAADPGLTIIEVMTGAPTDQDDTSPLPTTGGGLALLGLGVLLLVSGSRRGQFRDGSSG